MSFCSPKLSLSLLPYRLSQQSPFTFAIGFMLKRMHWMFIAVLPDSQPALSPFSPAFLQDKSSIQWNWLTLHP